MAWGQLYIETGLTSILDAAAAILDVLIAAIFFKDERPTIARGVGVGPGFLGVANAIGLKNFATFNPQSVAQQAIITATVSYAFAGAWARIQLSGLSPIVAAAGMLIGSTNLILPVSLTIGALPPLNLPAITWVAIA